MEQGRGGRSGGSRSTRPAAATPRSLGDDGKTLQPFVHWTTQKYARYCPAAAADCCGVRFDAAATGACTEKLLQQLDAIRPSARQAQPCAIHARPGPHRAAVESVNEIDRPKLERPEQKQMFTTLPGGSAGSGGKTRERPRDERYGDFKMSSPP